MIKQVGAFLVKVLRMVLCHSETGTSISRTSPAKHQVSSYSRQIPGSLRGNTKPKSIRVVGHKRGR